MARSADSFVWHLKEYEDQLEELEQMDLYEIKLEVPDDKLSEEQQVIERNAKIMRARESRSKMVATLERVKANEAELNAKMQAEQSGTPIIYGQTVQLLHVNSGKWLTVNPDEVAPTERENLRVYLNQEGDKTSWFKIMPGTAVAQEGTKVENWSEVVLGCALRENEYLHHSDKFAKLESREKTELREINCSLEKTAWRMQLYTEFLPDLGEALTAGQLIYLVDPGTDSYLRTLGQREAMLNQDDEDGVFFAPNETPRNSGGLWAVEASNRYVGGILQRSVESYYLRNMNTGKFIMLNADGLTTTAQRKEDSSSLVTFHAFSNVGVEDDNIRDMDLIQFMTTIAPEEGEAADHWAARGHLLDTVDMAKGASTLEKIESTCLIIRKADDGMGKESRTALAAFPKFQNLSAALRSVVSTPQSGAVNIADLITVLLPKFDECAKTCIQLIDFVVDGKVSPDTGKVLGEEDVGVKVKPHRQRLLKEQTILDVMLDILESCNPLVKQIAQGLFSDNAVSAIVTVCKLTFKVLRYSSMNNCENQLYIADRFHVMISYLDTGSLAMQTLSEMLNTNPTIQEDKVGEDEIKEFIDMLRKSSSGSSALTIINLLRALCSCQGEGIDSNQCMLADELLMGQAEDLLYGLQESGNSIKVIPSGKETGIMLQAIANPSHKQALEFLIGQLYLFAEMCFDRNYIAMQRLMDRLPYKLVVTGVADKKIPPRLRGAFVQLVSSLYVDTKPQEKFNASNLAFCWSKINSELPQPMVQPENGVNNFIALKKCVQVELEDLGKGRWDTCTMRMAELLQLLIDFKFYSKDELITVMNPLMDGLDQYNNSDMGGTADTKAKDRKNSMAFVSLSKTTSQSFNVGNPGLASTDIDTLPHNNDSFGAHGKVVPTDFDGEVVSGGKKPRMKKEHAELRKRVLGFLDWLPFMCFILFLVFFAITAAMIDEYACDEGNCFPNFAVVDYFIFSVFAIELSSRMWAVGDMKEFFTDMYATVDFVVVLLDIVSFSLGTLLGAAGGFGPVLRAVRFIKLMRVLKAARVLKALRDELRGKSFVEYKAPLRYTHTSEEKVKTMMAMVTVLMKVSQISNSWRISTFLSKVRAWVQAGSADVKEVSRFFKETMDCTDKLTLGSTGREVDDILLDLCLYNDTALVQQTISLLMLHHQPANTLLANSRDVQLMVNNEEERLFIQLKKDLSELQRQAESEEIWGALEEPEHIEISNRVKEILRGMTKVCKISSPKLLMSRGVFAANEKNQTMIRNLGGFDVVLTVLQLKEKLHATEGAEDGELSAELENTKAILRLNSAFLCWLVHDNATNQEVAFHHLETFIELSSMGVGATSVMVEVLRDNEKLIKLVPHDFLQNSIKMIVKQGRVPHYLDLLDVLTHIGDYGMIANQIEVVRQVTRAEYADKLLYLPGAPGTPMYQERLQLMTGTVSSSTHASAPGMSSAAATPASTLRSVPCPGISQYANATIDHSDGLSSNHHLPIALQYHTKLLHTLAGCAAGMINIVEAKVQSLYSFENVLHGLLDPETILEVKLALARFLFDVVVDVAILVPGLCEDDMMWRYMSTFPNALKEGTKALQRLEKVAYEDFEKFPVERLKVSYMIEGIIPNVELFYQNYFDETDAPWKLPRINKLISETFAELKVLYERKSPLLLDEYQRSIFLAMEKMRAAAPMKASLVLTPPPTDIKIMKRKDSLSSMLTGYLGEGSESVRMTYAKGVEFISEDDTIKKLLQQEKVALIEYLKTIPKLGEDGPTDVRYEVLLAKLVEHIHSLIEVDDISQRKTMAPDHTETTIWIIRLFRGMIEHEWGFTIEERDDEGDEKSDEKVEGVQNSLDDAGVTKLCLELIAVGISQVLRKACVRLLVALLYREGGCLKVQETISTTLHESNSDYFFAAIKEELQDITKWHLEWEEENPDYEPEQGEDPEAHESLIMVRFLQLMCEGHYGPNQDIMRGGVAGKAEFNLLDIFVSHIRELHKLPSQVSTHSMNCMLATILEVIQGPCVGNQVHFAINTEMLEILNRLIKKEKKSSLTRNLDEEAEEELRETTIMIFKALLEGQANPSRIYQRMLSVLHVEVLALLVVKEKDQAELSPMQVQTMVLLQMLQDYDPALSETMALENSLDELEEVVPIEVIWNGVLQRRFFAKDDMCKFLSDPSKDSLVQFVNRDSPETKLQDFVNRCRALHIEMKHQKFLESMNLSVVFSRTNQNRATWLAFTIALCLNVILLCSLKYVKDETGDVTGELSVTKMTLGEFFGYAEINTDATFSLADLNGNFSLPEPSAPLLMGPDGRAKVTFTSTTIEDVVLGLNVTQLGFSLFTLLLFWVVRVPVNYRLAREISKQNVVNSIFATVTDGLTLYYVVYVVFCVLAIKLERDGYLFTAFLLLDIIVKNSTTKDVLLAVYYPARQLMATAVLGVFVIYIFSFVIFLQFRDDVADDSGAPEACDALASCMMLTMNFGMRLSGGVGDFLGMDTIGIAKPYTRFMLDMLYFLIVLIVLLNIIFGIIIDTFSDLRVSKLERLKATTEKCFICDLDKLGFDRHSPTPNGFRRHIKNDHHMWNYFNFMIFLWEQDQDDDDGLELYVRKCLEKDDLSWFPMNTAMCLENQKDDKQGEEEIKSQLLKLRDNMDEKIAANAEMMTGLEKTLAHVSSNMQVLMDASVAANGGTRSTKFGRRRTARSPTSTSPTPIDEASKRAKKLAKELDLDHPGEDELDEVDV
jgi:inositol 1,4,5-triphosphate receptor type 3